MLRLLFALTLISASAAASEPRWFVSPGAILCGNYFDVANGEAAQKAQDAEWLRQTSCRIAHDEMPLAIIEKPQNNDPFAIWRLRVGGESVYAKGWSVGARLANGKRINYSDYRMHRWSEAR